MENIINTIGDDVWNIIINYKNEFERVEYNEKTIDICIFEEFDKMILPRILSNNDSTRYYEDRYHFNNISIKEFKEYYLKQKYILTTSFKFSIENQTHDYFDICLENINSEYLNNLKISYIYKLNDFKLCIFLGNFYEYQLGELYENIAKDYLTQCVSHTHSLNFS